ncbi:MAG TPA: SpoIIE family protein phosphatase [Actinomycetota bacterium]|nr:SpoIIE family protein phosphatase [Actinomycetota bacterium]
MARPWRLPAADAAADEAQRKIEVLESQLEASLEGSLVVWVDGSIVSFNRRFVEMWSLPPHALETESDQDITQAIFDQLVDPRGFEERVLDLYRHPERTPRDELRLKDGRVFEAYGTPLQDEGGRYHGWAWFFRDVSDRKRTEQRLAAQYDVVKVLAGASTLTEAAPRLLEAIAEGFGWTCASLWRIDEEAGMLRCVDVYTKPGTDTESFADVSRALLIPKGGGLPGFVWESGKAEWIANVHENPVFVRASAARQAGLHAAILFPVHCAERVTGVLEFFSPEIREPDHELLRMMEAIGGQIGQFVERETVQEEVRASEARKSAILEAALDCIVLMDHNGRVVEFNPTAERVFGYRRDDVVGKEMASLIIPPELRDAHRQGLARYLETGEGPVVGNRIEIKAMRADGTEFPVELAITRVDVAGPPLFTGYLRDIADRRQADEERRDLLAREQEARAVAEAAQERLAFLAVASAQMGSSLDYRETLQSLVDLVVPRIADWCFVDVLQEDDSHVRIALSYADPSQSAIAQELAQPSPSGERVGVQAVLKGGRPILVDHYTDDVFAELGVTEERRDLLRRMAPSSHMIVPLRARGRVLGALVLLSTRPDRVYGRDDLALAEELARRAAIAIDNARLFQERTHVARTLQKSLLPPSLPEIPGVDLAARYEPAGEANEVGGDFFDAFRWGRRRWALVIGDVSGKGPDAAAVTGLARHTLRAAALAQRSPSAILGVLNEALLADGPREKFSTVVFATLERTDDGVCLTAASGGHPPPLVLRRDGNLEELAVPGTLIGVFPEVELTDQFTYLEAGDMVVFYTDGVTDIPGLEDENESLLVESFLRAASSSEDPRVVADEIVRAAVEVQNGAPRDDIALLVLRVRDAT